MSFKYEIICQAQNSLKQNHKICYRYDHTECYSKPQKVIKQNRPQKVLKGRPHHKKWGILKFYCYKKSAIIYRHAAMDFLTVISCESMLLCRYIIDWDR